MPNPPARSPGARSVPGPGASAAPGGCPEEPHRRTSTADPSAASCLDRSLGVVPPQARPSGSWCCLAETPGYRPATAGPASPLRGMSPGLSRRPPHAAGRSLPWPRSHGETITPERPARRVLPAGESRADRRGDPLLADLTVPDLGVRRARPGPQRAAIPSPHGR